MKWPITQLDHILSLAATRGHFQFKPVGNPAHLRRALYTRRKRLGLPHMQIELRDGTLTVTKINHQLIANYNIFME